MNSRCMRGDKNPKSANQNDNEREKKKEKSKKKTKTSDVGARLYATLCNEEIAYARMISSHCDIIIE